MAALSAGVVVTSSDQQQRAASPPAMSPHRRSANYQPSTWDYDCICSSHREPAAGEGGHGGKHNKQLLLLQPSNLSLDSLQATTLRLRDRVRQLLLNEEEDRLRVIDHLQRFCVAYHFEEEIRSILMSMHRKLTKPKVDDLSSTALLFRMLREHGIPASSTDMLSAFTDLGNSEDIMDMDGLLALYEASHLAFPREAALEEAKAFAVGKLRHQVAPSFMDLPLHWSAPRLQAMWSLQQHQHCDRNINKMIDPAIVELARVDFNLVQAVHRAELAEITMWWKESGVGNKLPGAARDRVVECFFCAACIAPEPRLRECREMLAKTGALIVHLDDIFDVYGTLDELQAFTDAIGRWEQDDHLLPEYMNAIYSAICKTSVTAAERVLQNSQGYDVLPLYKNAWHDLCKAFLVEAQWQQQGHMPSFDEYLTNGWVTSTGPLLLLHALPTVTHYQQQIIANNNGAICYPRLVELSSRIFRLCNDRATHTAELERGDGPSSIACCMAEMSASEEQARVSVQKAIADTWKELNKEITVSAAGMENWNPCSAESMPNLCLNLSRIIHCIYQDGDGITSPAATIEQLVKDLLFHPIL